MLMLGLTLFTISFPMFLAYMSKDAINDLLPLTATSKYLYQTLEFTSWRIPALLAIVGMLIMLCLG